MSKVEKIEKETQIFDLPPMQESKPGQPQQISVTVNTTKEVEKVSSSLISYFAHNISDEGTAITFQSRRKSPTFYINVNYSITFQHHTYVTDNAEEIAFLRKMVAENNGDIYEGKLPKGIAEEIEADNAMKSKNIEEIEPSYKDKE